MSPLHIIAVIYTIGFLIDAYRLVSEMWWDVEDDSRFVQVGSVLVCCVFSLVWPVVWLGALWPLIRRRFTR